MTKKRCLTLFCICFFASFGQVAFANKVADAPSDTMKDPVSHTDATQNDDPIIEDQPVIISDPYERFNRRIFTFNENLDQYLFKPVATVYNKIIPKPLNLGIHNVFNNIWTVTTIINDVLQLHFTQTLNDVWRLGINTTLGIGGLFDVAERLQLAPYTNDFGLTMGRWGWRDSNYLVLPVFGPNTIRDGIEIPVDYYAFSIYPAITPWRLRASILTLNLIDQRAQIFKYQSILDEAAVDKYGFFRSAYVQRRNYLIKQNIELGFTGRVTALNR